MSIHSPMANPENEYAPIWYGTNSRQEVLYDMDTKHLENILRMFKEERFGHRTWQWIYRSFWVTEIANELQAREGELTRHPDTNEFMTRFELQEQRSLKRMILGLPPVRPREENQFVPFKPSPDTKPLFS